MPSPVDDRERSADTVLYLISCPLLQYLISCRCCAPFHCVHASIEPTRHSLGFEATLSLFSTLLAVTRGFVFLPTDKVQFMSESPFIHPQARPSVHAGLLRPLFHEARHGSPLPRADWLSLRPLKDDNRCRHLHKEGDTHRKISSSGKYWS